MSEKTISGYCPFNARQDLKLYNEKPLSCSQCRRQKKQKKRMTVLWIRDIFCTDPDLDPQIRTTDLRIRILLFRHWQTSLFPSFLLISL
jgi:hypothetical protein